MGRKNKPRMIPEQDKRICGSICFCQLTMVLSCVSIVYLSVAVYSPSFKAFKSGFELEPVMCQTIDIAMPNNCPWASCGEWCLTKTSGYCPQIHATVRRNGTDIQLNTCTRINNTSCPEIDPHLLKNFNCNNGSLCSVLRGVFHCKNGHCKNMSEFYQCHHKADGLVLDPEKDNTKLNGFFECRGDKCTKIKHKFSCDRYCPKITTQNVNVIIMQDDNLITADCETGDGFNEARGSDPAVSIQPTQFWEENEGILLTNCATVTPEGDKIKATDCVNGTLLNQTVLPLPFMNFTQFWKIYEESDVILDPQQRFLPKQSNITIYNSTKLLINLEGCVNTLRGECKEFVGRYGRDGDNNTAQSRYQCYYNKQNPSFVIARFDLGKTYRELLIALIVPIVLFIISSIALCIVTKSVKVGDDTKMRCKYCVGDNSDDDNENLPVNSRSKKRYVVEDDTELPPRLMTSKLEHIPQSPVNDHEMIGSTKSLIPLSPDTETSEKAFVNNDNNTSSTDNIDKPLVVI